MSHCPLGLGWLMSTHFLRSYLLMMHSLPSSSPSQSE